MRQIIFGGSFLILLSKFQFGASNFGLKGIFKSNMLDVNIWQTKLLVILLMVVIGIPTVHACSISKDYFKPTSFELVKLADVISLVKIEKIDESNKRLIPAKTIETIKGEHRTHHYLRGRIADFGGSDEEKLFKVRKGAYKGGCVAYDYKVNSVYLVFLLKDGDNLRLLTYPFSRVNAEIASIEDSNWLEAVRLYSKVSKQPDYYRQEDLLKESLKEYEAKGRKPIVADIQNHLTRISPRKPVDVLVELLKGETDEERVKRIILAISKSKENIPVEQVIDTIGSERINSLLEPVHALYLSANDIEQVKKIELDYLSKASSEDEDQNRYFLAKILRNEPERHTPETLVNTYHLCNDLGIKYNWLAFPKLKEALHEIVGENYAKHPMETLALIDMYDDGVVQWAENQIDSGYALKEQGLALQVIVLSSQDEADKKFNEILCDYPDFYKPILDIISNNYHKHSWALYERLYNLTLMLGADSELYEEMISVLKSYVESEGISLEKNCNSRWSREEKLVKDMIAKKPLIREIYIPRQLKKPSCL